MNVKVVVAWSGGKDSCFANYKATKEGLDVVSLLTFMQSEDVSNFHGIKTALLDAQANALDLPLAKRVTLPNMYEQQFKDALSGFKVKGVEGFITGDIYEVALHEKGWLERVCKEVGLKPIRPLWQGDTTQIFKDFINTGFKATVVRAKLDILDKEWLGRELDKQFLDDILGLPNVDPCGERGEYHTIVTDGPNFKNRINLLKTTKSSQNGYGHLDIKEFTVTSKKHR
jgi:diphthine-ammonia ligase